MLHIKLNLTGTDVQHGVRFECGGGISWDLDVEITRKGVEVNSPGLPEDEQSVLLMARPAARTVHRKSSRPTCHPMEWRLQRLPKQEWYLSIPSSGYSDIHLTGGHSLTQIPIPVPKMKIYPPTLKPIRNSRLKSTFQDLRSSTTTEDCHPSEPEGFISQSTLGFERDNTLIEELHELYSSKHKNMLDEARQYLFPIDNWSTLEGSQTVEDILEAPQLNYNLFRWTNAADSV
ncbi:hypothetical protein PROFUN_09482 [Planoprotostelium fungivorum]|uniref:Uncharacterized protein n=1 Tax=Planoprotostelium fungivorum TaxID=1890364 RepID=A0A2P6NH38_9EUKA|nr:hypothetical protein PROFUN_09482 [Planoprotostelium fungivorum]